MSSSQENVDVYDWLSFELIFALSVTCLLINIFLLVKIKFGGQIVTTLSKMPYMISLCLFILMTIEFSWLCFMQKVVYLGDEMGFDKKLLIPSEANSED